MMPNIALMFNILNGIIKSVLKQIVLPDRERPNYEYCAGILMKIENGSKQYQMCKVLMMFQRMHTPRHMLKIPNIK